MHEASLYDASSFVTLTYDQDSLPEGGSLRPRDVTLFLKRLRKLGRFRYFLAGEYGDRTWRPHYHALLFGRDFPDKRVLESGKPYPEWTSEELERAWGLGRTLVGSVTFESAAYVARYCVKKVNGPGARKHYTRVDPRTGECHELVPEFARMSRRPGIGRDWIEQFHSDVYPADQVISRGRPSKPPRYYDAYFEGVDSDAAEAVRAERSERSSGLDHSYARLRVREVCARARLQLSSREVV